jgi:hypothetical protein
MMPDASQGTWSYTQPSDGVYANDSDQVRFLLNDTSPTPAFSLSDEELEFLLVSATENGETNVRLAASRAARRMATAYTKSAAKMKNVGMLKLQFDYKDSAAAYSALADELLNNEGAGGPSGPIYADAGPGPFCEDQFDNYRESVGDTHDSFGHPLYWPY